MKYKNCKVGDIVYYTHESDPAIGIITKLDYMEIEIDWEWARFGRVGKDQYSFDKSLSEIFEYVKIITEKEKLVLLLTLE